ncbi:hypothetical protein [Evansella cellulosilytica]|uniref:Uncharacterized protein n=1 Tax=Evansella cellulosilytica (strain ATCC 21833 / DSM 2522 / FERM P-1141 / JCM 9156 / N-4) TaxID=649639 RepID=E6TWM4_EVAC2|nr:hypothetical protein [Evansella cellulosilytica]ADU28707.1 hypothetical protein Bcell_0425 [Evansella cellulosilytica DSM 2522]
MSIKKLLWKLFFIIISLGAQFGITFLVYEQLNTHHFFDVMFFTAILFVVITIFFSSSGGFNMAHYKAERIYSQKSFKMERFSMNVNSFVISSVLFLIIYILLEVFVR